MKNSFVLLTLCAASSLGAQQVPAIRQLGSVVATSKETFGPSIAIRHTKSGVLVNDVQARRVVMFDPALANFTVVADSTSATANAYAGRTAGLLAYRADSSLFVDPQSMSMLVIDPEGKVGRVMSIPRSQDAGVLGNQVIANAVVDPKGRLIYRPMALPNMRGAMMTTSPNGTPNFTPPQPPDTAAVIAVNLATRAVDTLSFTKIPTMKMDIQRDDNGRVTVSAVANPLPTVDDFAVLPDGSIAFVRGRDYHLDWVRPDGTKESTPKIPFEWKRLSDEEKVAFIDSVRAARERMMAQMQANGAGTGTVRVDGPAAAGSPAGGAPGSADGQRQRPTREGGEMIIMGGGGPGGAPPAGMRAPSINMIPPSELPDYQPVFFAGQVRADADGHLWVRTIPTKAIAGGPVYDVINAKGELVERVQVPKDRTIIGFGAGGVVYLAALKDGRNTLEKASFK